MSRPHMCTECHGEAGGYDEDYDDEGCIRRAWVPCEACRGCGAIVACSHCDEPMPANDAYRICDACIAGHERADAAAEMGRIGRRAS